MVCRQTCMKSLGATMYVLGFLVAGAMFICVGAEFDKITPDLSDVHYYIWVYAWALMATAVGIILETEQLFCGDYTNRRVGYFAGLFELVGIFGMGALGFGLAVYFSDSKNSDAAATSVSANDRRDLSSMIAVSSLVYLLGAVLMAVHFCREGKQCCNVYSALRYLNMVICVVLSIFWFLLADAMVSTSSNVLNRLKAYSYVIGSLLLLTGVFGFLKCCVVTD